METKEEYKVTWYYSLLVTRPTAMAKITIPEFTRVEKLKLALYAGANIFAITMGATLLALLSPKAFMIAIISFMATFVVTLASRR